MHPDDDPQRPGPPPSAPPADPHDFSYSVVVPVYNSADVVGETIDRIVEEFRSQGLRYQLVVVNDGSADASWDVLADRARTNPNIVAIKLLKNYGQHNANLAGLRASTGDWVITMDDDLQNPPDQVRLLIDKALSGHDVVFGEFETKQAAGYRRLGSKLVGLINRRVFSQPPDLVVSNFRIMHRDVVDRICASRTQYPYITGQALQNSSHPGNVLVRHDPRRVGRSTYSTIRILRLVLTILFSYSVFPMRVAAVGGFLVAAVSFLLGAFYLLVGWFRGTNVPGWTTLVVLLAMFNGVTISLLSMLGEYVVRTLNTVSETETYHVVERING